MGGENRLGTSRKRSKALTTAEKYRAWFNPLFRYALVKIEGFE
jgi:hypothetical protein